MVNPLIYRKLKHPHVVQFYGIICSKSLSIVMEYMEGGSLQDVLRIKKSQLSFPQLLKFCSEVRKTLNKLIFHISNFMIQNNLLETNYVIVNININLLT